MTHSRHRLPDRRLNETLSIEWAGRSWTMTIGFDRQGFPREVFADGAKIGSDNQAVVDDACVLISLLLQHGVSAVELGKALAREGIDPQAPAASILGLIAEKIAGYGVEMLAGVGR